MSAFGSIFIGAIFLIIACVIVYAIISGVRTWSTNNAAALLTLHCTVVAKRTQPEGAGTAVLPPGTMQPSNWIMENVWN